MSDIPHGIRHVLEQDGGRPIHPTNDLRGGNLDTLTGVPPSNVVNLPRKMQAFGEAGPKNTECHEEMHLYDSEDRYIMGFNTSVLPPHAVRAFLAQYGINWNVGATQAVPLQREKSLPGPS